MKQNDSIQNKDLGQTPSIQVGDNNIDALTILKNLLGPKPINSTGKLSNDMGREVKLTDALECIQGFTPTMALYGITKTGEGNIPTISKLRMITDYEEFAGENLLEWMVEAVHRYDLDEEGRNMTIRLMLGIYTEPFLMTYLPTDHDLRARKKDRITIFLVPHYKNGLEKLLEDEKATAYELGGLHP